MGFIAQTKHLSYPLNILMSEDVRGRELCHDDILTILISIVRLIRKGAAYDYYG